MACFIIDPKIHPTAEFVRKSQVENGEILFLHHRGLLGPSHHFGAGMEIAVFTFLIFFILLAAFMLYREFSHVNGRVGKLEERVNTLEHANSQRMPHKAQDYILDVISEVSEVLENNQDLNLLEAQRRAREEKKLEDALCRLKKSLAIGTKREE